VLAQPARRGQVASPAGPRRGDGRTGARAGRREPRTTDGKDVMRKRLTLALVLATMVALVAAPAALAAADINTVISNLRLWLMGLLAALATLFLTIGGIRYLLASGDPGALERAKGSIRAAIIGYGLALLAPVLATVVQRIVGA
jgi:Type IV secretion system pilin